MNKKIKSFLPVILLALILLGFLAGIRPMIVMSGSMEPAIKTGSICFVRTKADFQKIRKGDVITYNLLEGKITHRVVEKNRHGFITKGDANPVKDLGIVTKENYYGKVTGHIPYLGYVLFFLRKHILAFVFLIILIMAFPWKIIYRKRIRREEEEA